MGVDDCSPGGVGVGSLGGVGAGDGLDSLRGVKAGDGVVLLGGLGTGIGFVVMGTGVINGCGKEEVESFLRVLTDKSVLV
ncbi:MAG: hypothetical protein HRU34_23475 [Richelia sp.]|nr:hypothetical protein [Richelia sp.]CDN11605.1 hypothetical protein RintRC_3252 [Richelia intracellularis]